MICFHNPEEENGYLSNWFLCFFEVDGITFSSVEQYMMYTKAKLFRDERTAEEIMQTDDVTVIKALGRSVSPYDDESWSKVREEKVYRGVFEKFRQNEELGNKLLNTGQKIIAECAVKDKVWGTGLSMKNKNRFWQEKWTGKNLLGKILMRVRHELRTDDFGIK